MDSLSAEIPYEVAQIVGDLAVISGLPSGSKLNCDSGTYAAADSWVDSGYRAWNRETCMRTIDYINGCITNAVRIAITYPNWQYLICSKIVELENAIRNLIHVYNRKPRYIERFKIMLIRITAEAFNKACEREKSLPRPERTEPLKISTSSRAKLRASQPALSGHETPNSVHANVVGASSQRDITSHMITEDQDSSESTIDVDDSGSGQKSSYSKSPEIPASMSPKK